jgi:hypothetical protein
MGIFSVMAQHVKRFPFFGVIIWVLGNSFPFRHEVGFIINTQEAQNP